MTDATPAPDGIGETVTATDGVSATMTANGGVAENMRAMGRYSWVHERDGVELARGEFDNIITTAGKNFILDTVLGGSAYTANLFLGLKGTGAAVAADTQASHAGWVEQGGANAPAYSGTRKVPAFSAAAGGIKTTSTGLVFTFTSGGTVYGGFLNAGGTSAQDNTTGVLLSAGDMAQSRVVLAGDSLTMTFQLQQS